MPSQKTKSGLMISRKAPKNASKDSREQPKGHESPSVYDYLYHDVQRIASFLAQFETYGVLGQVKATESAGRTTAQKTDLSVAGKVPLVAEGRVTLDVTTGDHEREAAERTYDPLWTNARTFLNYLADRSLIERDLRKAAIGQFVLASGRLSVSDLSLARGFFKVAALRQRLTILVGNEMHTKNSDLAKQGVTPEESGALVISLIDDLSHSITARLQVGELMIWSTMVEKFMVVPAADIILKHGLNVEGHWNILGILDAYPSQGTAADKESPQLLSPIISDMPWSQLAESVATFARRSLGRPITAYGMTPLLIFREVRA